ncbi:DUF3027 domain-containing protein [Rathayibacter toxicus]|nr:DUF3027 domain-containing protein [Rathayibacter toxicus]ALS56876.1 hypothetical protein APU90_03090 [Rathayibacter toxicus]QOD07876.1 DUF3027 domain-containing protein [Rathayibacter toxicus]QOD09976.1 DUF3027 domain-containing protein [Rathayibacter toxicus]
MPDLGEESGGPADEKIEFVKLSAGELTAAVGSHHEADKAHDSLESTPVSDLDPVLAASEERARAALTEITSPESIGDLVARVAQGQHVVSLQFASRMRGYPGWLWTATLSRIDEAEDVTVLEVELLPGEGAILAPDWVPWSVRLADYRAAQDVTDDGFDDVDDDELDDLDGDLDEVADDNPEESIPAPLVRSRRRRRR